MARDLIANIAGGLFSDLIAANGGFLSGALGAAVAASVQTLFRKRMETARDIMVEEVRLGTKSLDDAAQLEEIVACMLRYGRAAEEGAARLNLRLMAAVLNGLVATRPIYASEFLRLSSVLSDLSRDEIIAIACALRWKKKNNSAFSSEEIFRSGLCDGLFLNKRLMDAHFIAILRTGFFFIISGLSGTALYKPTPLLDSLCDLLDIESVLERDLRMNEQHAAA